MTGEELEGVAWWACVAGSLACFGGGAVVGGCVLLALSFWMW